MRLVMDFADVVRALRVANDLSQTELGIRAGFSRHLIALLEGGLRPTSQQVDRLAVALGVPRDVLTGGAGIELLARNPAEPVEVLAAV